jgi:hypothetical protein
LPHPRGTEGRETREERQTGTVGCLSSFRDGRLIAGVPEADAATAGARREVVGCRACAYTVSATSLALTPKRSAGLLRDRFGINA